MTPSESIEGPHEEPIGTPLRSISGNPLVPLALGDPSRGPLKVPHGITYAVPVGSLIGSLWDPFWGPLGVCYELLGGLPIVWPLIIIENTYHPSSYTMYTNYNRCTRK